MSTIPQEIIEQLQAGNLIPFVGAGVSRAVTDKDDKPLFPSWHELLKDTCEELKGEYSNYYKLVEGYLGLPQPNYLMAAEHARKGMKDNQWYQYLKKKLDLDEDQADPKSLALAKSIWELGSKLIITTNYDSVLQWTCPEPKKFGILTNEAAVEHGEILKREITKPAAWHLHGVIRNKGDLIITTDGYDCLYPDPENSKIIYESALKTLETLMVSHTFLFIGFSLDDPFIKARLKSISETYKGAINHFALVHEDDKEKFHANDLPVKPIFYEDYGQPLIEKIQELTKHSSSQTSETLSEKTEDLEEEDFKPPPTDSPGALYSLSNTSSYIPFRAKKAAVIGREGILENIRYQLTEGKKTPVGNTAALYGIGGLGKTQLAVEYAHKYRDSYPNGIIWLTADQDLDPQLIQIAEKAKWISPESEHNLKLDVAKQRLRSYSNCLIVFDNVENPQDIDGYLPDLTAEPHILVTSHKQLLGFEEVPLNILNDQYSLKLLFSEAGRHPEAGKERDSAKNIADLLDGLPLALELAGAYLNYHKSVTWEKYQTLLEKNLKQALPKEHFSFTKHSEDLFSTLKITENEISVEPLLGPTLDLLTWSGSSFMGISLMCSLLGLEDASELTGALSLGVSLKLLGKHPNEDRYALHRLVRQVRQEEHPLEEKSEWAETLCQRVGDWFEEKRKEFNDLAQFEAEFDHLKDWGKNAEKLGSDSEARLIWLYAYPPYHRGHYQKAEELVQNAHERFQKNADQDLLLEANLLADLGETSRLLGNFKLSMDYHKNALKIRQLELGEEHTDTISSYTSVGNSFGELGQYKKELIYCQKALDLFRKTLGNRNIHTAKALDQVGSALGKLGRHEEQLKFLQEGFEICKEHYGEQHPDTAGSLNNIGGALNNLGKHNEGLKLHQKALKISQEQLGEQHPNTAACLNNVGYALGELGKHEEQLELYQKALKNSQKQLGEQHPVTALSLNNVGYALGELGNHKEALKYYERALKIRQEQLGKHHPDTISTIINIAITLNINNEKQKADDLLENTLKELPKDHKSFIEIKNYINQLKSQPPRPGFRSPSSKPKGNKKKKSGKKKR